MYRLLARFLRQPIKSRVALLESLSLVLVYICLSLTTAAGSPARELVENVGILVASSTAILWILHSIPELPASARRVWLVLGFAELCWLVGSFLMGYLQSLLNGISMIVFAAHILNLAGYLLAGCGLFLYPFRSQHAPTRFRFILDALISSGAVVTMGLLVFVLPGTSFYSEVNFLIPVSYPIADCVLLILLANFSLANWIPRRAGAFLGAAWMAALVSDFAHSSLVLIGNYQPGSLLGLGWICSPLLIGLGAVYGRDVTQEQLGSGQATGYDLGAQFQKVLPIALELVLFWYVLADWRLHGKFSPFGLWMSVLLGVMLIVRLGIRAGEAELDQYWRLVNNLADPSFIADTQGRILLGNPACSSIIGGSEHRAIPGHSLVEVFAGISPESVEEAALHDQTLSAVLRTDSTPYLLTLSPIVQENRRRLIAGVAHNLGEQKRQTDAIQRAYDELQAVHNRLADLNAHLEHKVEERTGTLQQAYRELEEQNRVLQSLDQIKTDFVSMVSHELRAPLTNIGGGVELLLGRRHNSADAKTLLLIQSEILRLTRFVENILNVSAMQAGQFMLHPTKVSLPPILFGARDAWGNLSDFERIKVDMGEGLPLVTADEQALQGVFGHLLDNALKYAPQSAVQIGARLEGQQVCVAVTDFGPGVPEEKRDLLFQRFQRLEARDSQTAYGYGLGLYLSQQILRAMGSDLLFEPPASGGARFYFYLQVAQ